MKLLLFVVGLLPFVSGSGIEAFGGESATGSPSAIVPEEVPPLSTDRPDTTESAFTVPRGMFQVEATLFGYARDRAEDVLTERFTWGAVNLKYGLTSRSDLQLIFDSYTVERTEGGGIHDAVDGFSDITLRFKQNMRGNKEPGLAWALMPYLKIPTDTVFSNREWEGGLIVPFGVEINELLTVNWMVEGDVVYNEDRGRHEGVFLHSLALAWNLEKCVPGLGLFTECVGEVGSGPYRFYANGGITYGLTDNIQLDAAVNFGLTEEAEDFACFTGVSFRF